MEFPILENLSGPQESIFSLSRRPQLHFRKKTKNSSNFIKFPPLPLLAHVGPMAVWGLGLLLCGPVLAEGLLCPVRSTGLVRISH